MILLSSLVENLFLTGRSTFVQEADTGQKLLILVFFPTVSRYFVHKGATTIVVISCGVSGRGQGSAAGAAEDHMTCMLDAYKCMGANVFFVCFARETLGTKNAKCKRGCSFSFASETLGTTQKIEV